MPKLDSAEATLKRCWVTSPVSSKVQRLVCDWRRAGIFCNHSKEGARNAASMLDNVVDR